MEDGSAVIMSVRSGRSLPIPAAGGRAGVNVRDRLSRHPGAAVLTAITPPAARKIARSKRPANGGSVLPGGHGGHRRTNRRLSLAERRGSTPLEFALPFSYPPPGAFGEDLRADNSCELQRDALFTGATAVIYSAERRQSGSGGLVGYGGATSPTPTTSSMSGFSRRASDCSSVSGYSAVSDELGLSANSFDVGWDWATQELEYFLFSLTDNAGGSRATTVFRPAPLSSSSAAAAASTSRSASGHHRQMVRQMEPGWTEVMPPSQPRRCRTLGDMMNTEGDYDYAYSCERNGDFAWSSDGEQSQGNQSPARCRELCDAQRNYHSHQLNAPNRNNGFCGTFTGSALTTSRSGSAYSRDVGITDPSVFAAAKRYRANLG